MSPISTAPIVGELEIPIDTWTAPFWEAAADHRLTLPRCPECATFRWPPGPFCPSCQSQAVEWVQAGEARLYSYTVVRPKTPDGCERVQVPALVEFPEAGGVRLLAAIVDAPLSELRIGCRVFPDWITAANAQVPVFKLDP